MDVIDDSQTISGNEASNDVAPEKEDTARELALVKRIQTTIRSDKKHHAPAFDRMRRDMFIAQNGRTKEYSEDNYTANVIGRHIQQKTASLYAKNPKAIARRRETLDFQVWDESPASLNQAMQAIQLGYQAMQSTPTAPDTMTGEMVPVAPPIPPELEQAFQQAQAVLADFTQGMERRKSITKIGKTLEILFAQALREQKPLDFKTAAKQLVRRACTTGVGYVEIGFQREMGPRPGMMERLADSRARLDHLRQLVADAQAEEFSEDDAEAAELEATIMALQAEPEIVLREGLIFDFPQATKVIPDKLCQSLVGFVGARHLTVEYLFTKDEVKEMFGVDLDKNNYKGYTSEGKPHEDGESSNQVGFDSDGEDSLLTSPAKMNQGLVCVWKHYDKPSGLVYFTADGYNKWLRAPASPDVFVEDFWPVYALTFNAVESEENLFPPSDVTLLFHQQMEYNRSRQGMREHRQAARPRWVYSRSAIEDKDVEGLKDAQPFSATGLNIPDGVSVNDVLQLFKTDGVDPNLYETSQLFGDMQIIAGTQEAQLGGTSKSTATESAIAASSTASSSGSNIDDLDAFLTMVARSSGQVLLKEMSPEQVMLVAGPGAEWPQMTLTEISSELFLEVEAGSTGKPNQAVELQAWERMVPLLIQIPGIDPTWLARETIRRLDDRLDINEALAEGLPSVVMQNAMQQPAPGDPGNTPNQQGGEGANNAPQAPGGEGGSGPAFGSNQV